MSLVNVPYVPRLTWANPALASLEEQALIPMLGENPIELGLKNHEEEFIAFLRRNRLYQRLFGAVILRRFPIPRSAGNFCFSRVSAQDAFSVTADGTSVEAFDLKAVRFLDARTSHGPGFSIPEWRFTPRRIEASMNTRSEPGTSASFAHHH